MIYSIFGMMSFALALVPFAALYMAWGARKRIRQQALRIELIEQTLIRAEMELAALRRGGPAAQPPQSPSAPTVPTAPTAPTAPEAKPVPKPAQPATSTRVPQIKAPPPEIVVGGMSPVPAAGRSWRTALQSALGGGSGSGAPPPPASGSGAAAPPTPPGASHASGGLEERLGTMWAVWAGGLALALGGIFLVRFSIEAGLLGPGVRVLLGLMLAAVLIGGGEWLRRTEYQIPVEALPQAHIPSILTAAGTVVAFGTLYAAHALYGFIGPAAAFVLLGATAILTMVGAALHGPWLAGLGLVGAFVTPLLIDSAAPSPWPVVLYLTVVTAAAYALARMRKWLWLATAAVVGAVTWGVLLAGQAHTYPGAQAAVGNSFAMAAAAFALLQLALGALFVAIEPNAGRRDTETTPDPIAAGALAALSAVVGLVIANRVLDLGTMQLVAVLAIGILSATAWRTAPAAVAAVLAGLIGIVVQLAWPALNLPADVTLTAPDALQLLRLPQNISNFMAFSALALAVPAALAVFRLWRSPLLPVPSAAIYAAAVVVPPLLGLMLAYLRVTQFDASIPFAVGGALLAGVFAYGAERFHSADADYDAPAYNVAAGALAVGAIAALCFAFFASLERGYLTVMLALTALGTAYVATRRNIPILRYAVSAIGIIVLIRVVSNPRIMGDSVGTTPIFNWLLLGYGVPAFAFWQAARLLDKQGDTLAVRLSDALAVIFTALLAFFQIRHLTNNGDVLHANAGLAEAGLLTLVSLGLSFALARMNNGRPNMVFDAASLMFAIVSLALSAVGLLLFANPVFTGDRLQSAFGLSTLTLGYLLPGLAALYVARHARAIRPRWYTQATGILAVVLITMYVTLEVRHAFHGDHLSLARGTTDAEQWAYSFAWLILGVGFLAYGLVRGSIEARLASAALIVLSALKITLYDLAGIGGLWRALSFICLGAVLIGIGLVYQKFIFARPAGGAGEALPPAPDEPKPA